MLYDRCTPVLLSRCVWCYNCGLWPSVLRCCAQHKALFTGVLLRLAYFNLRDCPSLLLCKAAHAQNPVVRCASESLPDNNNMGTPYLFRNLHTILHATGLLLPATACAIAARQ